MIWNIYVGKNSPVSSDLKPPLPHGHFGHVYLLQIRKNDGEKCCFLKKFGFINQSIHHVLNNMVFFYPFEFLEKNFPISVER